MAKSKRLRKKLGLSNINSTNIETLISKNKNKVQNEYVSLAKKANKIFADMSTYAAKNGMKYESYVRQKNKYFGTISSGGNQLFAERLNLSNLSAEERRTQIRNLQRFLKSPYVSIKSFEKVRAKKLNNFAKNLGVDIDTARNVANLMELLGKEFKLDNMGYQTALGIVKAYNKIDTEKDFDVNEIRRIIKESCIKATQLDRIALEYEKLANSGQKVSAADIRTYMRSEL